jgi:hypothetical protein
MGVGPERDAAARRDILVQQLLEERRQRLQQKLCQDAGVFLLSQDVDASSPGPELVQDWSTPVATHRSLGLDQSPRASRHPAGPPSPSLGLGRAAAEFSFGTAAAASLAAAKVGPIAGIFTNSAPSTPNRRTSGGSKKTAPAPASPSLSVADHLQASRSARGSRPSSAPLARGRSGAQTPEKHSDLGRRSLDGSPHSFGQRLQEWSLRHQAVKQRQLQAKQEKEMQEMEQCTFKPSINSRSEFYARRSRGCYVEPLPQRLHHEADKRAMLRNKAKELLEADAMCSYTFRPQINKKSSSNSKESGRTPIHLRAEAIQQMKQDRVRSAQVAEDKRSECYFQPRISERSERLVQKQRDKLYRSLSQGAADAQSLKKLGPVEERLYAEAQEKEQRRATKQDSCADISAGTPSVDEASKRICKSSVYFQGAQQDFLTRQQTFELARQRRLEVRAQHAEAECSFRPKITETSRHIVAGNVELLGETVEERVNRLAVRDVERRSQLRGELEQLHYRDCTFKPEVNVVSQMLAASRCDDTEQPAKVESQVHERLYRSSLGKSRFGEDSRSDEYSFRPQLDPKNSKRFLHVKPHYSRDADLMETIRQDQERKEEFLSEKRREKHESIRQQYTFTPQIREAYEEPDRPVLVSGLGRFFELKSLALKKQQEQEEREARAFRAEVKGTRFGGVTIPEPFDLSTGSQHNISQRASSEWSQRNEECTFAPKTNESANREIIKEIMRGTNFASFREAPQAHYRW